MRTRAIGEAREVPFIEPELQERLLPAQWMAQELCDHLLKIWDTEHGSNVPEKYRPRVQFLMTSTLRRRGTAFLTEGRIVLYPDGQRVGTLVHEVAHFIAYSIGGLPAHDKVFKAVHVWLLVHMKKETMMVKQQSVAWDEPKSRPATMFGVEDLPLFSGTPVAAREHPYIPQEVARQARLGNCFSCFDTGYLKAARDGFCLCGIGQEKREQTRKERTQ